MLGADYLSVLAAVDVVVGNSSSGILEAATFGVPVVNVGDRQRGRASGDNVVDVRRGPGSDRGRHRQAAWPPTSASGPAGR